MKGITTMTDVVDLIMQDHREVERLFDELKTHPEKRAGLLPVLTTLLSAHSRAEEAEVYPAARDEAGEGDDVAHSQQEHVEADELLAELAATDPAGSDFDRVLEQVVQAITHHVEEEETKVLPGLRDQLTTERLAELAEAFSTSRKAHLGEQPDDITKAELSQQAANAGLSGAASMSRDELTAALRAQAAEAEAEEG